MMRESNSPIIPVFYHVKPADLRWTRGKKKGYARALEKLEKKTTSDPQTGEEKLRYNSSTIENWRNTLSDVAGISGFELEQSNGDEGELVDKVVEGVLKKLRKPALDVSIFPTGLDDKINDFKSTLEGSGKSQIIGIVGLGGVGKTTMAKEFFNRESSKYNRSCFLFDVRDNKYTLNLVQKILLKSLTGLDNPINSVAEGIGMLRMQLSSVNALVIIDDVDHEDQVDALLPHQTVLHSNSLILITSRNKDILSRRVGKTSIYMLTGLNAPHARELFCCHAFHEPYPVPGFEPLVEKILKTCDGLPLSLKVFGSLLYDHYDKCYWQYLLDKLEVPSEIQEKLKISYDSLSEREKQIFLDIACYFIGEERDTVVKIWDGPGCKGSWGFQNIQNKCLVDVNSENEIKMHDHLRDLGREIADTALPLRLWRPTEKIHDLLQQSAVINEVRGIRLLDCTDSYDDNPDVAWYQGIIKLFGNCLPKLCNMPRSTQYPFNDTGIFVCNVQLLDIEGVLVDSILRKVQSPNLIWLRWKNCPHPSLPSSILMENLRILQVEGRKLETLWQEESQAPLQLRELRIEAPLSNIPKSVGRLKHLERIVISPIDKFKFESLVPLTKLPEEFCLLQSLKALVLEKCSKIKSLPDCFGKLSKLHHIQLSGWSALERLPESFGNLINLQKIQLFGCGALERLPDSFGNLTNLEQVQLYWCRSLERLPESFGNLCNLQHINLYECSTLGRLPDSFPKLINLQYLQLEGCSNLNMSSETLGDICTLEHINLTGCGKIEVLPTQVAHQRSLEQLRLGRTNLKELPSAIGELGHLEVLVVGGPLLDTLPPSLGDLKNLKKLTIENCNALKYLPASLDDLRNLKELTIWRCPKLKCLPVSIGKLTQLTELDISDCPLLRDLPFKEEVKRKRETLNDLNCILPRLQWLYLGYIGISEVSFAEGVCYSLLKLGIESCNNVVEVGTLPNTVTYLSFPRCNNLRRIDKICGLVQLQYLDVRGCIELEEIPGIETLVSLKQLRASGCVKLKSIQGLGQLTKLQKLSVCWCSELQEVEGIQNCMSLVLVGVEGCPKLQWGPGVLEQLRQRCSVGYFY